MSIALAFTIALAGSPAHADVTGGAQLTALLAEADSIDAVSSHGSVVEIDLVRAHESFRVAAATKDGTITSVQLFDVGPAAHTTRGALSWLSHELASSDVATLTVADDGAVSLTTKRGAHYALIAATGGNAAVSARWAAAWDVAADE